MIIDFEGERKERLFCPLTPTNPFQFALIPMTSMTYFKMTPFVYVIYLKFLLLDINYLIPQIQNPNVCRSRELFKLKGHDHFYCTQC